ncbi:hypothetical protein [Streptomyces clavuligerus]|uniref:hypothetical protein n=1 Tax=Streptomyces clavuligerus TaxID=1901 RepID=UPI0027DE42C7|nr:hypothetical protein [Streptomyces clavuligerus]
MIQTFLTGTRAGPPAEGAVHLVHDLLWAHARPSDGLEHVRARRDEHGLDVFLFVDADSDRSARAQMAALLGRVDTLLDSHGFALDLS